MPPDMLERTRNVGREVATSGRHRKEVQEVHWVIKSTTIHHLHYRGDALLCSLHFSHHRYAHAACTRGRSTTHGCPRQRHRLDYLRQNLGMREVNAIQAKRDLERWCLQAIENGNVGAVRYLLEVGMNADMMERWGVRGVFKACKAGHIDVAKLLRAHGARLLVCYEDEDEGEDAGVRGPSNEFLNYANGFAPDVREWVLSPPPAGDGLFFAAPPPVGRPPAADAAKWWPYTGVQRVARYYTALRGCRRFQARRLAPRYWTRLRMLVATRRIEGIVLYWQEYTVARLCAPGGSLRAADEAAFKADLAPVIDEDQAQMRPCAPGGPLRIADQAPSAANLAQVIARCDAAQANYRTWVRFACNLNNQQRAKERKWEEQEEAREEGLGWEDDAAEAAAELWEYRTYVALASTSAGPNKNADRRKRANHKKSKARTEPVKKEAPEGARQAPARQDAPNPNLARDEVAEALVPVRIRDGRDFAREAFEDGPRRRRGHYYHYYYCSERARRMGAEPRQRPKGFTVWEAMHGASELERSEGWREQRCCLRPLEIEDAELARALHFSQLDWACAPHLGADADGTLPRPLTPLERHTAEGAVMG